MGTKRFFLRIEGFPYHEVSKAFFAKAEFGAGHHPEGDEPCTGGFGSGVLKGTVVYSDQKVDDPDLLEAIGKPSPFPTVEDNDAGGDDA